MESAMLGLVLVMVFTGGLYAIFNQMSRSMARDEAIRTMVQVTDDTRMLYSNRRNANDISSARLIVAGIVPDKNVVGDTFQLPYGGLVTVRVNANSRTDFYLHVQWTQGSSRIRDGRALCYALAAGDADPLTFIDGPMGTEYTIHEKRCSFTNPNFTLNYAGRT